MAEYLLRSAVVLPFSLIALWLLRLHALAPLGLAAPPRSRSEVASLAVKLWSQGLLWSLALLLIAILPPLLLGAYASDAAGYVAYEPWYSSVDGALRWLTLGLLLLQSGFEELLFRGLGLALLTLLLVWIARLLLPRPAQPRRVWLACGLLANLVISGSFAAAHLQNPEANSMSTLNIALAGFWLGGFFVLQRSILGAWGAHFGWNYGQAILGLPISGIQFSAPQFGFGIHGASQGIMGGGGFGPEATIFSTLGLVLACFWQFFQAWRWAGDEDKAALATTTVEPSAPQAGA
jgi:hypothetical protein